MLFYEWNYDEIIIRICSSFWETAQNMTWGFSHRGICLTHWHRNLSLNDAWNVKQTILREFFWCENGAICMLLWMWGENFLIDELWMEKMLQKHRDVHLCVTRIYHPCANVNIFGNDEICGILLNVVWMIKFY